jgi:hypothetical protein
MDTPPINSDRRKFIKDAGFGVAVAAILGPDLLLTPAEAKTQSVPLKVLDEIELATLESAADVLLPGASEAGVGYFIDEQLSRDPNDSLLIARYLQVPPPYVGFYKGSVQALNGIAQVRHEKIFTQLPVALRQDIIASLFPQQPKDWRGPPSQPVYLCLRSDAIDVVYGTMEGFADLGIPYMAHIEPPSQW